MIISETQLLIIISDAYRRGRQSALREIEASTRQMFLLSESDMKEIESLYFNGIKICNENEKLQQINKPLKNN